MTWHVFECITQEPPILFHVGSNARSAKGQSWPDRERTWQDPRLRRGPAPEGVDEHYQAVGSNVAARTWRAREGALEGGHVPELCTAVRA